MDERSLTCEFSLAHYEECLELIKGQDVILTHDIDLHPQYALELARLEHAHGIRATYYVLLHSEWYNALSPESIIVWRQLLALGHEIGLHYDSNYGAIELEAHLLEALLGTRITATSRHMVSTTNPIPHTLEDREHMHGRKYIADSSGMWKNACICQHIGKEPLVANLHPIWWLRPEDTLMELQRDSLAVLIRARKLWEKRLDYQYARAAIPQ